MGEDRPRRRPFAGPISDEVPPSGTGPLGTPGLPVVGDAALLGPAVAKKAANAVLDRLEPTRMRVDALGRRTQALLLVGAGAAITIGVWVVALWASPMMASLSPRGRGLILIPQALGPALLVYGVQLMLLADDPPPPASGGNDRFGGVLVEAQAEARWKMRLVAVGLGIVHAMIISAAT